MSDSVSEPRPIITLAPLHGITGFVFRNALFSHFPGFDAAMAPFILPVRGADPEASLFKDLLPERNRLLPLVPQLLGNDAEAFLDTAAVSADLGYRELNWNMGCPYPMVANKRRGSGLLPHPELVEPFLDEVCVRSPLPVSVKLRLGRYDKKEIEALAPILNAHPLSKVIIHPRLGVQLYEGEVDLDGFADAAALLEHPVVYNGDIMDLSTFSALASRFPSVHEWMIGRGALSDPFLPARIKGLSVPSEPLSALLAFHKDLYDGYRDLLSGPQHVLDKMKEVWSYLRRSLPDQEKAYRFIVKAKTLESYETAVSRALAGLSS